jgi:predicted dehydrogenase
MIGSAVRVGFLGTGFIATAHSKQLRSAGPDLLVRGSVFDSDHPRAEQFAQVSGHTVARSVEEVIDTSDAIFVTTWTSEHRSLLEQVVAAGKAVFCEKPLATSLRDAIEMTALVEANPHIVSQAGLILRHSPLWALAHLIVNEAAAGKVMAVVFRDDQFIPTQGHYGSQWRADVNRAGAGTLIEHSVHDVDLIRWVCGDVETVNCTTANFHGLPGIEDVAMVNLRMVSGASVSLTSVWHDNLARASQRHVEFICAQRLVTISGDDYFGTIRWEDSDGTVTELSNEAVVSEGLKLLDGNMSSCLAFVRSAATKSSAHPSFRDALNAQRVVHRAYESAALGGAPISIDG